MSACVVGSDMCVRDMFFIGLTLAVLCAVVVRFDIG